MLNSSNRAHCYVPLRSLNSKGFGVPLLQLNECNPGNKETGMQQKLGHVPNTWSFSQASLKYKKTKTTNNNTLKS